MTLQWEKRILETLSWMGILIVLTLAPADAGVPHAHLEWHFSGRCGCH